MCVHRSPNCAGYWKRRTKFFASVWECTSCGASYATAPTNDAAASRENVFAELAVRLQGEGRQRLEAERGGGVAPPVNRLAERGAL